MRFRALTEVQLFKHLNLGLKHEGCFIKQQPPTKSTETVRKCPKVRWAPKKKKGEMGKIEEIS